MSAGKQEAILLFHLMIYLSHKWVWYAVLMQNGDRHLLDVGPLKLSEYLGK